MQLVLLLHNGILKSLLHNLVLLLMCCPSVSHPKNWEKFHTHNAYFWAVEKLATLRSATQYRFSTNVSAGILGYHLIRPYYITSLSWFFCSKCFHNFWVTTRFLHRCNKQCGSKYSWTGDPVQFSCNVRNHLDITFGQQWVGLGGPVRGSSQSPDLSYLSTGAYEDIESWYTFGNAKELIAGIAVVTGEIWDMPGIFQIIWNSTRCRYETCIEVDGRNV